VNSIQKPLTPNPSPQEGEGNQIHPLIPNGVFLPSPPRGEGPGVRGSIIDLYRLKTSELYEVKKYNTGELDPETPHP